MQNSLRQLAARVTLLLLVCFAFGPNSNATELNVFAAVSLKPALVRLATDFEKKHTDVQLSFNFAASGDLEKQIEQGAQIDIFAAASLDSISRLEKQHLVSPDDVRNLVRNELVIISSMSSPCIVDAHQLLKLSRIAIGDPQYVPVGTYAKSALQKWGLYSGLQDKQKLLFAQNARQVITYVETGDVDAGIVYRSDALTAAGKVRLGASVPEQLTGAVVYPITLMKESKHRTEASEFINYLLSTPAQAEFQARGFSTIHRANQ